MDLCQVIFQIDTTYDITDIGNSIFLGESNDVEVNDLEVYRCLLYTSK